MFLIVDKGTRMSSDNSAPLTEPKAGPANEIVTLQNVVDALAALSVEGRKRVVAYCLEYFSIKLDGPRPAHTQVPTHEPKTSRHAPFSQDTSMSAKEFMLEKDPRTDVERIACLAYYLTHYRSQPHFKTVDISALNVEAAQPRFSNAAFTSKNAVKAGFIVPSIKGQRQLSAAGERFVRALPDREQAKSAMEAVRRKPRPKKTKAQIPEGDE